LAEDQKESLAEILSAIRRYCNGEDVNTEKILRVTLSGVAGTGKSTWINTLVTTVRKMFTTTDTISVFAPTGCAAFNAGGETIHRGFGLPREIQNLIISSTKTHYLQTRFGRTLVIIIDERSMMDAAMLGIIKYTTCNNVHIMAKTLDIHGVESRSSFW
jgi:septin family protein